MLLLGIHVLAKHAKPVRLRGESTLSLATLDSVAAFHFYN